MKSELSWGDWLLRGAATGLLAGVVLGLAARVVPFLGIAWTGQATIIGLVAALGLAAAASAPGRTRRRALLLATGALAASSLLYWLQGQHFELFGLLVLGAGLGAAYATALRPAARPWGAILAVALTPVVTFALRTLLAERLFGGFLPPIVTGGLVLGLAGAVLSLPALAARFAPREDTLERRAADARRRDAFDPEIAPLVDRALALRASLRNALGGADPDPAVRDCSASERGATAELEGRVDTLCAQMLALAERHHALIVEAKAGLSAMDGRADDLRRRAAAATDTIAAAEYGRAADMADEQSKHALALRESADRVAARLCSLVATLERVQLGVAGTHGGAAERAAWDLAPVLDALRTRAAELESEASAIAEAGAL